MTETRATDASGGQKGVKPERYDLLPAEALEAIARVYGFGEKKYSRDNWQKGYPWSWSFAALMRHLWAFWRGEDVDSESGELHLAHAGFHVLALLWFSIHRRKHDDRYRQSA